MEEKLELLEMIRAKFPTKEIDLRTYSPLTLAFLGDCVFEIVIRTVIVERANKQPKSLHQEKAKIVNAVTQAKLVDALLEDLTQEEEAVYRRGRNATSHSSAKNASMADYRKATGLEALCGYLYLNNQMERVLELIQTGLERLEITI